MVNHERTLGYSMVFLGTNTGLKFCQIGVISLAMAAWDAKMDVDVVEAHCYMRYAMNLILAFEL